MSLFKRAHPGRARLFEHAENLLARHVPFASGMSQHLGACPACRSELAEIRRSLELVQGAGALQPSRDAKAAILLAAKTARPNGFVALGLTGGRLRLARGMAFAVAFLVVSGALLRTSKAPVVQDGSEGEASVVEPVRTAGFSLETLREVTLEEELLGTALMSSAWIPQSRWERAQWQALIALDKDIEEALEALGNNPALVRASDLVNANRQRKKETLKALYVKRDL